MPPTLDSYGVVRGLPLGRHPYAALLPHIHACPTLPRIAGRYNPAMFVATAVVNLAASNCVAHVDTAAPCIVLDPDYYYTAAARDLYLDLLHELTHLRQHLDGLDIWDERLPYEQRPTEIEAFACAAAEAQRLGLSDAELHDYLANDWLTPAATATLYENVLRFLRTPSVIARGDACYVRQS